jgi:glyoxylase-like metal-dependent hydrolase (beta-lactamase superfamily II)
MGMLEACASYDLEWRDDVSGSLIGEGDVIELGDMAVHIFETPGHSSCAVSAYVPRIRALFPTDSGGIPYENTYTVSGNSDYTKYQESLEKLQDLEVDYYCADHYGYVTGTEARDFILRSIETARTYRGEMEKAIKDTGSVEAAAKLMAKNYLDENPNYFLAPDILEGIYGQMVKHIAKNLG